MIPPRAKALFISDLHLQPTHPRTSEAFFAFLRERAVAADALYLLGDIFEYWIGDDDLETLHPQLVAKALRAISDAGVAIYWMAGNRDFLVGAGFAQAAGLTILSEPHVADIGGQRIAIVHGDAQCTDDVKYMAFRSQVRDPAWQQQFLSMPLAKRREIAEGLRQGSKEAQVGYQLTDVAPQAIADLHMATGCDTLIHGHTHRPALHVDGARRRYVLPDWDLDTEPPRGGWIAIAADGSITRHALDGAVL